MEAGNDLSLSVRQDVPGWITADYGEHGNFVSAAARVASQMLLESLDSTTVVWNVKQYFESLKKEDPFFEYKIARQNDNAPTGKVWVTGTMHYNYETHGSCLSLDTMLRQQNYLDWPYLSVVVINGYK